MNPTVIELCTTVHLLRVELTKIVDERNALTERVRELEQGTNGPPN